MPPIAILVALADPTRCRLIELLRAGPLPVHVLAAAFKISRPAISRHLRVLKQSGLISESKFGRENRYTLHTTKLVPVLRWLNTLQLPSEAKAEPPAVKSPGKPKAVPVVKTPPTTVPIAAQRVSAVVVNATGPIRPGKPAVTTQMGFDF